MIFFIFLQGKPFAPPVLICIFAYLFSISRAACVLLLLSNRVLYFGAHRLGRTVTCRESAPIAQPLLFKLLHQSTECTHTQD